mmetsp:Transcript_28823/g.37880  ORF Transcript_28823/g.37880 Transcript_28823/m.37880 type:complete len:547 (-) Transcript_28823:93-1733(-)
MPSTVCCQSRAHSEMTMTKVMESVFFAWFLLCLFLGLVSSDTSVQDPRQSEVSKTVHELSKSLLKNNHKISISKKGTNQVHSTDYKKNCLKLDISKLTEVKIDQDAMVAHAEPCINMDELVKTCLPYGLLPKVCLEFKRLTVGGAVMGAGLESSSHMHGQFNDICSYLKILKGNGEVVTCSKDVEPDLFNGVSGSYGTLGVLLQAGIQLEPCQKYVRVNCKSFSDLQEAVDYMKSICRPTDNSNDDFNSVHQFVEGIVFPPEHGGQTVVMVADYCSNLQEGEQLVKLEKPWGKWYYERVRDKLRYGETDWNFVHPTYDYIFRYDRGCFWMARPMAFLKKNINPVTLLFFLATDSNLLCRILFRWLYTAGRLYKVLNKVPPKVIAKKIIAMDVYTPWRYIPRLVQFVRATVPISTPLWLCPVRPAPTHQPFSPHGCQKELIINVGIYGRVSDGQGKLHSRRLEHWTVAHNGRKMLYSQNFYSEREFWGGGAMFDRAEYEGLREKYSATNFPDLFTKTCGEFSSTKDTITKKSSIISRLGSVIANMLL